jgi:hypothetical protein
VQTETRPAERKTGARQEIDYGRRAKGYIFGAFCTATGEAFTHPDPGRGGAPWVDFLDQIETWIPRTTKRMYAVMDNLNSHRITDVLLFLLAHPLGYGVPAQIRGLSHPDRALVEDPALARLSRSALRDLGGDHRGDPPLPGLLECPPPPLRLGQTPPAQPSLCTRHCPPAEGRMIYRMHERLGCTGAQLLGRNHSGVTGAE